MQMCAAASVDYLPRVALFRMTFPPRVAALFAPCMLPVKHGAILRPEALVYLFEQIRGSWGIQMRACHGIYAKQEMSVHWTDGMMDMLLSNVSGGDERLWF